MKQFLLAPLAFGVLANVLHAQPFDTDAAKQGLKGGVHWVKRTWYSPLPPAAGANNEPEQPDMSKVPNFYMRPNQLMEYSKEGKMRSCMDFKPGTDNASGSTMRYYWDGNRLKKEVLENADYEAVYTIIYTYDASGHEIKRETTSGPGDKIGITSNRSTERSWEGDRLTKEVRRNAKGALESEVTYTYDAQGRKTREDYYPTGLYAGRSFRYDAKGMYSRRLI